MVDNQKNNGLKQARKRDQERRQNKLPKGVSNQNDIVVICPLSNVHVGGGIEFRGGGIEFRDGGIELRNVFKDYIK